MMWMISNDTMGLMIDDCSDDHNEYDDDDDDDDDDNLSLSHSC